MESLMGKHATILNIRLRTVCRNELNFNGGPKPGVAAHTCNPSYLEGCLEDEHKCQLPDPFPLARQW